MKRNTKQRDAVRNALTGVNGFRSAQQIFADLQRQGSTIALTTVYRTLNDLTVADEADSLQSPNGELLFRSCVTAKHHHHLVCQGCGLTKEIDAQPVELWAKRVASEHGFNESFHTVDVFGLCSECVQYAL